MIRKINHNFLDYKLSYRTSNTSKFISSCNDKNIKLKNINKNSSNELEFEINERNYSALKSCKFYSKDNAKIIECGGVVKIINTLKLRIGLIVGFVVCLLLLIFLQNKLLYIEIAGNENISSKEITKSINSLGIGYMTNIDKDMTYIEDYLTKTHNLSMVSVITKGNALIINIKESLPDKKEEFVEIIAEEDMVIKSIIVHSGTSKFTAGNIVKKGDVLVYPYYYLDNEKINVKPYAEIEYYSYVAISKTFKTKDVKLVRSGRSKILSTDILLGNKIVNSSKAQNDYKIYDTKHIESVVSKYFLPISILRVVAYELVEQEVLQNFDECKEKFVESVVKEAYDNVNNLRDVKEEIVITKVNDDYVVSCYLETIKYLRYN